MFGSDTPKIQKVVVSGMPVSAAADSVPAVSVPAEHHDEPVVIQLSEVEALRQDFMDTLTRLEACNALLRSENSSLRQQLIDISKGSLRATGSKRKLARQERSASISDSCSEAEMISDVEFPALPASKKSGKPIISPILPRPFAGTIDQCAVGASTATAASAAGTNAPRRANHSTNANSAASNAIASGNVHSKNKKKIMQAIGSPLFSIRQELANANINSFEVKQVRKDRPVKITISDHSEVGAAKAVLSNANVSYHEFKWAEEKQKCFVIRGLVGATENDLPSIKRELLEAGLPEDISLSLHVTGHMRANPGQMHSAPVKLVVPPNFDDRTLVQLRHLNHVAVRFELFKSKTVVQCKNCQRFGHSSGGCQHAHRCVKCGANHLRDACPRTNNSHTKLKCCNCGGEHTANNLNACSFFKQHYSNQQRPLAKPATPTPILNKPSPSPRQAGISFAQMAGGSSASGSSSRGSSRSSSRSSSRVSFASTELGPTPSGSSSSGRYSASSSANNFISAEVFYDVIDKMNQRFDKMEHILDIIMKKSFNG